MYFADVSNVSAIEKSTDKENNIKITNNKSRLSKKEINLFVIILVLAFKFRILIASGALDFPTTLIVIYICIKPIATS